MKMTEYLKSKLLVFLVHLISMVMLSFFLLAAGNTWGTISLILFAWLIIAVFVYGIDYGQRNSYFKSVFCLLDHLDKRYLIGEVMPDSFYIEDIKHKEIIRQSSKSVIEAIREIENEQRDYQEYIESWVHEIKSPLTSIQLICANHKDESTRKILVELAKVDHYVDTALVYARSNQVHTDYLIKACDLKEIILEAIARNQQYLIQNQMKIEIKGETELVSCDKKWLEFILTQILLNAAKYKKGDKGTIVFYVQKHTDYVSLIIQDFGIGIAESDLSRVFEKGFTGNNGRTAVGMEKATGMGLYLCKKLCINLGLAIDIRSVQNEYTKVCLTFPKNSLITKM